jgi:hypothetical protein
MRTRIRWIVCVGLIPATLLLSGCLFNIFQTARLVRGGDVALVVGAGLLNISIADEEPLWTLTPQARLTFGLFDGVNLGFQTGVAVPLTSGTPGWMGASGDIKFSIFDDPDSFSLAVGIGGGSNIELLGWGVFGEVFLDSNLRVFPVFIAYQPTVPLTGENLAVWHHLAVGLKLRLSERARLLLQVDVRAPLLSFGFAVDIGHRAPVRDRLPE